MMKFLESGLRAFGGRTDRSVLIADRPMSKQGSNIDP